MAATSQSTGQRQAIAMAIATELERQAREGAPRVDVDALAEAIEQALGAPTPAAEGRHPDELNATNDD